jgi:hypothetical protein
MLAWSVAGRRPGLIDEAVFGTRDSPSCAHEEDDGQTQVTVRLRRFGQW